MTERDGHGYDLANLSSFDGYDGLVVVGGDGTIHEVINGMLQRADRHKLPIGVIPAGTGNSMLVDVAAVCDLVNDPEAATRVIIDGTSMF